MQNTDWIAGLSYDFVDGKVDSPLVSIFEGVTHYVLNLGGRCTLSERPELELGVRHERSQNSNFDTETEGEAALVYRLADKLDVALGAIYLTGANSYGIGVRYTWK